jgi:hypothetical protein
MVFFFVIDLIGYSNAYHAIAFHSCNNYKGISAQYSCSMSQFYAISCHVYCAEKWLPCYDCLRSCLHDWRLEQEDYCQKGGFAKQKGHSTCRSRADEMKCTRYSYFGTFS